MDSLDLGYAWYLEICGALRRMSSISAVCAVCCPAGIWRLTTVPLCEYYTVIHHKDLMAKP